MILTRMAAQRGGHSRRQTLVNQGLAVVWAFGGARRATAQVVALGRFHRDACLVGC